MLKSLCAILALAIASAALAAETTTPVLGPTRDAAAQIAAQQPVSLEKLPPAQFLDFVRQPLRKDVWGEVTGRVVHKKGWSSSVEAAILVRVSFTEDGMAAQIVLNDANVYGLTQHHDGVDKATIELDLPPDEQKPGLFDLGLEPEDLSFAFIYWDFMEELPRETSRWQPCRVMKLASPKGDGYVKVLFSVEHGFPMEAEWYKNGEKKPWRTLVMKGARKYENGLWFVSEMRLDGKGWKTSVKFDYANLNPVGNLEKAGEGSSEQ